MFGLARGFAAHHLQHPGTRVSQPPGVRHGSALYWQDRIGRGISPSQRLDAVIGSYESPEVAQMSRIRPFDHVGITVTDLDRVSAFFVELGFEIEGRTFLEGEFLDTVIGMPGSRTEIVMLRPPRRRHGARVGELHSPEPRTGFARCHGQRTRIAYADDDEADVRTRRTRRAHRCAG